MERDVFLKETRNLNLEWYKQADSKAQVILGFTGVFLSIVVGLLLSRPADSKFARVLAESHSVVGVLALTLVMSCVSPVLDSLSQLCGVGALFAAKEKGIYFFGHIANYESASDFSQAIGKAMAAPEHNLNGLVQEVLILSKNTRLKHRLVNLAVAFSGAALIFTVALALTIFSA